jgi:hypothetical protein
VILRAPGICFPACEFQVSGLNILHSYRFQIFGQGRYRGLYESFRRFLIGCGPQYVGDLVEGVHECAPVQ